MFATTEKTYTIDEIIQTADLDEMTIMKFIKDVKDSDMIYAYINTLAIKYKCIDDVQNMINMYKFTYNDTQRKFIEMYSFIHVLRRVMFNIDIEEIRNEWTTISTNINNFTSTSNNMSQSKGKEPIHQTLSVQSKSDETTPEQTTSEQTTSEQTKSEQSKSDETKSEQTKPEQTTSNETQQTKPEQTTSDETQQTTSEQSKSDETKSDETTSDETKSEQSKSDETKSDQQKQMTLRECVMNYIDVNEIETELQNEAMKIIKSSKSRDEINKAEKTIEESNKRINDAKQLIYDFCP